MRWTSKVILPVKCQEDFLPKSFLSSQVFHLFCQIFFFLSKCKVLHFLLSFMRFLSAHFSRLSASLYNLNLPCFACVHVVIALTGRMCALYVDSGCVKQYQHSLGNACSNYPPAGLAMLITPFVIGSFTHFLFVLQSTDQTQLFPV